MRELIVFLLLILSSCLGVSAPVPPEPRPPVQDTPTVPAPPRLTRELLVVEEVEGFVLGTYPTQLRLGVRGYWPSGCSADVMIEQRLEGDTLTMTIWRELPAEAVCPAVIVPYHATIPVEGDITRLPSVITVNGWTLRMPS